MTMFQDADKSVNSMNKKKDKGKKKKVPNDRESPISLAAELDDNSWDNSKQGTHSDSSVSPRRTKKDKMKKKTEPERVEAKVPNTTDDSAGQLPKKKKKKKKKRQNSADGIDQSQAVDSFCHNANEELMMNGELPAAPAEKSRKSHRLPEPASMQIDKTSNKANEQHNATSASSSEHVRSKKKKRRTVVAISTENGATSSLPAANINSIGEAKLDRKRRINSESADDAAPMSKKAHHDKPGMTDAERHTLLTRMASLTPASEKEKTYSYSAVLNSFDWSAVAFDHFSADDCRKEWTLIQSQIRKQRTVQDILDDAQNGVYRLPPKKSNHVAHPDRPKAPVTVFFRYANAHRNDWARQFPGMSGPQLMKEIAGYRWRNLSTEEKKRYEDEYRAEKVVYDIELEKFLKSHPNEVKTQRHSSKEKTNSDPSDGSRAASPIKSVVFSPVGIYVKKHIAKAVKANPQARKIELVNKYRAKWGKLTDAEKLKYIEKAITKAEAAKEAAAADTEEAGSSKSITLSTVYKAVLTKEDQAIKAMADGVPRKPAMNGYNLFSKKVFGQLKRENPNVMLLDVTGYISKQWNSLSEEEKNRYARKATKEKKAYADYIAAHPEHSYLLADSKATQARFNRKKQRMWVGEPEKPPGSGYYLMWKEQRPTVDPKMSMQDLSREMGRRWTALSAEQKKKYNEECAQLQAAYEEELAAFKETLDEDSLAEYLSGNKSQSKVPQSNGSAINRPVKNSVITSRTCKAKTSNEIVEDKKEKKKEKEKKHMSESSAEKLPETPHKHKHSKKHEHKHSSKHEQNEDY